MTLRERLGRLLGHGGRRAEARHESRPSRRSGKMGRAGKARPLGPEGEEEIPIFNFIFKSKFQPNSNSFVNFDQTQTSQNKYA